MSDYYLAAERARQREQERNRERSQQRPANQAQDVKVTLLGDFLLTTQESQGCDPYNSTHGKPPRDVWASRKTR